ncbi:MAG TPA: hypothetical protein VJH89_04315, partial [Patescibacteria group bacterium]|nr:hypothetical protein [Patescibacteria group bacterium]
VQARARVEDLPQVLEKIKSNYSAAQLFMILYPETNGVVQGLVKSVVPETLTHFADHFKEGELRGDIFSFSLSANSLDEAEQIIVSRLVTTT